MDSDQQGAGGPGGGGPGGGSVAGSELRGDFRLPVLVPEIPIFAWLSRREAAGWPALAVLDLSRVALQGPGLRALVQGMTELGVRVVGLTGIDAARLVGQETHLPPLLPAMTDAPAQNVPAVVAPKPVPPTPAPQSLLLEENLRSGQSIRHMAGDVSVIGTVASGAEIVAGGSIHVYGTLRGRALAGAGGGPAQIFCHRLEAELLAINGHVLVADDMDPALIGHPVRAARAGDTIRLHRLA